MMLLEHDAKELLAELDLPVPSGRLVRVGQAIQVTFPAVLKAQVPVGGRGKAGGIKLARGPRDFEEWLGALPAMTIKGHRVLAFRVEDAVDFVAEAYLSFTLDPGRGDVRILMSPHGGVDVENEETRGDLIGESVVLDADMMRAAIGPMAARLPERIRKPVAEAAQMLVDAFFLHEATLLEINPLFIRTDGSWVIGDTKLSIDENALPRAPRLRAVIEDNHDLYPEAALKLDQGFDFVRLDEDGNVGLVTTGAGLSMQLIDELVARGQRPFNFCDIRTGEFQGSPARLIQVLQWIADGQKIQSVLINFFAGHTDLGEIAQLLIEALKAVPQLRVPITARFIGNGLDRAREVIAAAGSPIIIETSLERAIDLAIDRAGNSEAAHV